MKKILLGGSLSVIAFALCTMPSFAAKPTGNQAGVQKYAWHLSGDVMPVPPYGSLDIPGSDTASKLIVNQPNGKVQAMATGDMNGLNPNTIYTVYLSNPYTKFVDTGWNVAGNYTISLDVNGTPYIEYLTLQQSGNVITGKLALDNVQTQSVWNIDSGSVSGDSVVIYAHYGSNAAMKLEMNGTISSNGSISGTWHDVDWNTRMGNWSSTNGNATKTHIGDTGWTGQLAGTTPFTFMTDGNGSGSWHYNFRNTVSAFSVWINGGGGTLLISDSVSL